MSVMRMMRNALPVVASTARRRRCIALAALVVCLCAATAHASDRGRAERLYTKGLAELHAGRKDAAIALFEQAVVADPNNVHGLYYRGLGFGHAGRFEEAVADLKVVVVSGDRSIGRARLELGYVLYRLERYEDAAAELRIASQQGSSAGEAALLLGIVETRRGNHEAARAALSQVATLDPDKAVAARYYQGLAAYRAGDTPEATEDFQWVREHGGDSPFAREASDFLDSLREGESGRRYRLHAGFALEYDSNVALAPGDDDLADDLDISNESDGRAVITAGGKYAVYSSQALHLSLGYDFLQSLHFDLERFDVQTHKVGGEGQYVVGPATFGVAAAYEHSLLDEDSLLNGGTLLPWLRYEEGDFGRTELYYRMRRRNFLPAPFDPVRDSYNHAAGIRQFFSLGARNRNVFVGYRFDTVIADEEAGFPYDYDGNQVELGVDWAFTDGLAALAIYTYKHEDYAAESKNRDDDEHQIITRVEKRLVDYVWLVGSYIYRRNLSDQNFFDYSRHITSLGVEVRY